MNAHQPIRWYRFALIYGNGIGIAAATVTGRRRWRRWVAKQQQTHRAEHEYARIWNASIVVQTEVLF